MSIPELISLHFIKIQWAIGAFSVLILWRVLRGNERSSQFRVREADRKDLNRIRGGSDTAQSKIVSPKKNAPSPPPLSLPGIRLDGEPHEILGIAAGASEIEIMKAYKDAIKRFHPDRIQGPAQEQMQFYQQAAAKLNQAKEEMLKRVRKPL